MSDTEQTDADRAERYVLGSAVICQGTSAGDVLGKLMALVDREDFASAVNGRLWGAVQDMLAGGIPIDVMTLAAKSGLGPSTSIDLLAMAAEVPSALNAEWYARIVAEAATKRRLRAAAGELATSSCGPDASDDIVTAVQHALATIAAKRRSGQVLDGAGLMSETVDRIEAHSTSGGGVVGVVTGLPAIDRLLGGFRGGSVGLLAARTSVGKSALAGQIALAAGCPVLFVSLEMSRQQMGERWISQAGGHDYAGLRLCRRINWTMIHDGAARVAKAPIELVTDEMRLERVCAAAIRWRSRHPTGLALVIIDYLQLVVTDARGQSREQAVAEISRRFKGLAQTLDVPVLALAQLNRAVEQGEREPRLSDLRESGALEQDADVVLFLSRERESDTGITIATVAKNRDGRVGRVKLIWRGDILRFDVLAEEPDDHDRRLPREPGEEG